MKMISRYAAIVAAMLCVSGCSEDPVAQQTNAGPDISVSGPTSGNVARPVNLPPFVPIFPGARITTTTLSAQEPDKGLMTLSIANPDQAAIIAFYKGKGEAAGLTSAMEMVTGEARIIVMNERGTSSGEAERGFQLTVTPDGDGGSMVTIVYVGGETE